MYYGIAVYDEISNCEKINVKDTFKARSGAKQALCYQCPSWNILKRKKKAKSFVIEFLRSAKKAVVLLAGVAFECCHSGKRKKINSMPALRSLKWSHSAAHAWEIGLL